MSYIFGFMAILLFCFLAGEKEINARHDYTTAFIALVMAIALLSM